MGTTWRVPAASAGFEAPRRARGMGKERPGNAVRGLERLGAGHWHAVAACSARRVGDVARARVLAESRSNCFGLTAMFSKILNKSAQSGE
jgi:hypothetical protein